MISFSAALNITLQNIHPLELVELEIVNATGRVVGRDLAARVNSPSLDVSLKDGYAVHSTDIATASPEHPITLQLAGHVAAGDQFSGEVQPGSAVRILSGAPVPAGATAIVADELTHRSGSQIHVMADSHLGRNILKAGTDLCQGQILAEAGEVLHPTQIGLLAAAGYACLPVHRRPRVMILGTGDEVVAPGEPLPDGKLYASNLVTLAAWCRRYDIIVQSRVVPDDPERLRDHLLDGLSRNDALLTSGGAWKGDHDLVAGILDEIGWHKHYHRIKLGPGKAVGFGTYQGKPVFCLPGGPPSNFTAFISLALPGLLRLAGFRQPGLPCVPVRLTRAVRGQIDWTQIVQGVFERRAGGLDFHPLHMPSRLQMLAQAEGLLTIPEGVDCIPAGSEVEVQVLNWPGDGAHH